MLTVAATLSLALQCAPTTSHPDELARVLTGIALQESRLDPAAKHPNTNGTIDYGLLQVNSAHIGRAIGYHGHVITAQSLLDPCESMAAGGAILLGGLSAYNTGDQRRGIANGYAARAVAAISQVMDQRDVGQAAKPGVSDKPAPLTLSGQFASFR